MRSLASWLPSACVVPLLPTCSSRLSRIENSRWAKPSEDKWVMTSLMPTISWKEEAKGISMIYQKAFQTSMMAPCIIIPNTTLRILARKVTMQEVTLFQVTPKLPKANPTSQLWWARCNRTPKVTSRKNKWCRCLPCSRWLRTKEPVAINPKLKSLPNNKTCKGSTHLWWTSRIFRTIPIGPLWRLSFAKEFLSVALLKRPMIRWLFHPKMTELTICRHLVCSNLAASWTVRMLLLMPNLWGSRTNRMLSEALVTKTLSLN